ncbi:MAG: pyruvate formate lyase family protein, partial [Clostridia bacterium]|nr:pyruvate formate lyase family protein [Clostridia bacterium]
MSTPLLDYIASGKHRAYRRVCSLDLAAEFAALKLSPIERMVRRLERMLAAEMPVILEDEQICFMRTLKNLPDCFTEEEWKDIRAEYDIHELGYLSNLSPNYGRAISRGLLDLRNEADEYGARAIDAILNLTDRYREKAVELGRTDIAEVLARVPRYGASTFLEALQSFRIINFALWYEGNYHITVGRFDRYMYPYLKADLEAGILTEEAALALIEDFFISFNKDSDLYPGVQQGDNGQSMMLGGVDENGCDCFNLLSSLCLKASRNNMMIDPKINLRVSASTPAERFTEATELTKAGLGFPQYSNDDVVIPALISLGYAPEDAANYTVAACWEFIIPHVGADVANIAALSYPAALDRALHRDLAGCESYEDFFACVLREIGAEAERICSRIKKLWFVPSPFMNVLMDCNIYEGGKYNNFGIHGTGIATAADSLAVIKRYVFEERSIGKAELLEAVDDNFE